MHKQIYSMFVVLKFWTGLGESRGGSALKAFLEG